MGKGKTAAIFGSSPDLEHYQGKRFNNALRIAVNHAILADIDFTHYCFGDKSKIDLMKEGVIPVTGLKLKTLFVDWRTFENKMPWSPIFSILAAVGFAHSQGARKINFYGVGMDGDKSFAGGKGDHSPERWKREIRLLNELMEFYVDTEFQFNYSDGHTICNI